ncbi:MAG: hypothetical protein NPIRA04_06010 [Nitrospirales bacterium]|nr:MAG: hypothetical protein NPIRA04_06010 [Nitrospirales bacterium]
MMTRRCFLKSSLLVIMWTMVNPLWVRSKTSSIDTRLIPFRWRVPEVHKEEVEKTLRFEGKTTTEKDTKGLMTWVFVGLILLPDLAKSIYDFVQGMEKGGVKIDTREGKFDIDTDKSLPPGMVALASDEGTELYERDELSTSDELVSILLKAH